MVQEAAESSVNLQAHLTRGGPHIKETQVLDDHNIQEKTRTEVCQFV